jgi:hypothetical protein
MPEREFLSWHEHFFAAGVLIRGGVAFRTVVKWL